MLFNILTPLLVAVFKKLFFYCFGLPASRSLVKLGHQLQVYCKASGSPWLKAVKESGDDHDLGESGNFLGKCYFCQKRLRQQDAPFMYGSLRAFFTPECRDNQIAVDKVVAKHNQEEQGMNATGGMM